MKSILKFFLGRKLGQGFFRLLFRLSLKGMNFGGGSDFRQSGEEWVINYFIVNVKTKRSPVIFFDVGANIGEYAKAAGRILKEAGLKYRILCFEPAKSTFEKLKENTTGSAFLEYFNVALGESASTLPLYSTKAESGLASLYKREMVKGMDVAEEVMVETLDNFCPRQNIESIDFLKLDVEGNEYKVLLGAKNFLQNRKIHFIQFEFGGTDIDSRIFFRDFYKLLSKNYNIYRVLKNGLYPIEQYSEADEIFITTNYLAILKP